MFKTIFYTERNATKAAKAMNDDSIYDNTIIVLRRIRPDLPSSLEYCLVKQSDYNKVSGEGWEIDNALG